MNSPFLIALLIASFVLILFYLLLNKKEKSEERFKRMVSEYNKPPAHSLNERKHEMGFDIAQKFLTAAVAPLVFMLSLGEQSMLLAVSISIITPTILFYFVKKDLDIIYRLKKGARAEMVVGMALESSLDNRFTILHDFQLGDDYNNGSNIDHLVISPTSICIVETKYKSCPTGMENKLTYDRQFITDPSGYKSNKDIKQAKGLIKQFKDYCRRELGIDNIPVNIEAFIVYPGWDIDFNSAKNNNATPETNIRVNSTERMLTALKTIAGTQQAWGDTAEQNDLVKHLTKKNKVKIKLKN